MTMAAATGTSSPGAVVLADAVSLPLTSVELGLMTMAAATGTSSSEVVAFAEAVGLPAAELEFRRLLNHEPMLAACGDACVSLPAVELPMTMAEASGPMSIGPASPGGAAQSDSPGGTHFPSTALKWRSPTQLRTRVQARLGGQATNFLGSWG